MAASLILKMLLYQDATVKDLIWSEASLFFLQHFLCCGKNKHKPQQPPKQSYAESNTEPYQDHPEKLYVVT